MQQRRFLLFITSCLVFVAVWLELQRRFWPPVETPPAPETVESKSWDEFADLVVPPRADSPSREPAPDLAARPPVARPWGEFADLVLPVPRRYVSLGEDRDDSPYHLRVLIDPRGAGVRSVILNKFKAADDYGRPTDRPLELIPESDKDQIARSSYLVYHYDPNETASERPLDTLGEVTWHQVGEVHTETDKEGHEVQTVVFEYTLEKEGVKFTKVFRLQTGDYHLGLEVRLERTTNATNRLAFRYQLAGPHGLPIEGKWYTNIFRNAVILREDKDQSLNRTLEDSRQIGVWGGGTVVTRDEKYKIRYAGITLQFFASVLVVSDEQEEGIGQDFVARARPTLEVSVTKGILKQVNPGQRTLTLAVEGRDDQVFYLPEDYLGALPPKDSAVAVISHVDGRGHDVVNAINGNPAMVHPNWETDVSVRMVTEPVELLPGKPVVHRYVLYNGPVKPRLLNYMTGVKHVDEAVVERYTEKLGLRTLTDYQSSGMMGTFLSSIGWTWLVIKSTNLMHSVFGLMNHYVTNLGLSIILLTVLVRGLMFPISRKGALTSLKMQELAPEINKIKEKFGDDKQAAGLATMELYRKNGVNPFGTCWFMLLQMPVFMGLYFALQESITFRLATFPPTWITNLAAPDMLFGWGENIPFISRVQDYGGWIYLGPYLNLLPMVAVSLMVLQQKLVTPPPTDEQQEMQQKMMKYMVVVMGFMFYKVAAGLAIYFIASSLWGFAERALLPRKKAPGKDPAPSPAATPALTAAPAPTTAITATPPATLTVAEPRVRNRKQGRNKRGRNEPVRTAPAPAPVQPPAPTGPFGAVTTWWRRRRERLAEWWREILEQAEKKNRTERKK